MARSRHSSSRMQRDNNTIAKQSLLLRHWPVSDLRMFEDRRQFYPEVFRPARGVFSWSSGITVSEPRRETRHNRFKVPHGLSFSVPRDVFICVRRKNRRSVLFAKRKTGKGARARVRRRNEYSDVRC